MIDATGMPGMTSADAADAFPRAANRTVLFDRADEVLAARRIEATLPAHDGTQSELIHANQPDQHLRR